MQQGRPVQHVSALCDDRLQGAPGAAALPVAADPGPAGTAGAGVPAGTEVAAHTVGAFAPEVSVKPVAGAGGSKISPIAEPTAEAAEARTLATETAPGQGAQGAAAGDGAAAAPAAGENPDPVAPGQGAQAAAAGGGAAAAPAAGENPNPVAPVATAANSSLVTATGDSFDLPKPHDASTELAAGEVGAYRLSARTLPCSCQSDRQRRLHAPVSMPGSGREQSGVCAVQGASSAGDGQGHKGTQVGAAVVEATTQSPTAPATDNGGAAQAAAAPADATQRSEIQVRCSSTLEANKATPCTSAFVTDGNVVTKASLPTHCRQHHRLRRPSPRQQGRQCVRTRSNLRGAFALAEATQLGRSQVVGAMWSGLVLRLRSACPVARPRHLWRWYAYGDPAVTSILCLGAAADCCVDCLCLLVI
jgi:hypothetical protein